MTPQDIIKMARSVNINRFRVKNLQAFAKLVAAAEREACAKIADKYHVPMCDSVADAIAGEIRSRGNQE